MKKILFVCSHFYSGSSALYEAMNHHPKIQGFRSINLNSYPDAASLMALSNYPHKLSNRSAIYMDELLHNRSFYAKEAYSKCSFIYVVREPEIPISFLIANEKKKPIFAVRYYTFRLRRLCEMAKRTPGAVLLTWQNLIDGKGMDLIKNYLNLKDSINFDSKLLGIYNRTFSSNLIDIKLLQEVQDAYERYLYFLKNQKLVTV